MAIVYGISAPLGTVLSGVFLYRLLGRASFVAMALTALQIPIPARLTVLTLKVQKRFALVRAASSFAPSSRHQSLTLTSCSLRRPMRASRRSEVSPRRRRAHLPGQSGLTPPPPPESISSLRITKLFGALSRDPPARRRGQNADPFRCPSAGLEAQVKRQIQDLRKAELDLNKQRKLLRLFLSVVNTILVRHTSLSLRC